MIKENSLCLVNISGDFVSNIKKLYFLSLCVYGFSWLQASDELNSPTSDKLNSPTKTDPYVVSSESFTQRMLEKSPKKNLANKGRELYFKRHVRQGLMTGQARADQLCPAGCCLLCLYILAPMIEQEVVVATLGCHKKMS